ncbi:catalase HPII [Sphingobium lactosutens]|uniref:catalase n=1 Tax=Sphingobium lactosutens TaxID=522773 RepID=UPI0015BAFE24|nr:catalase HPII [Sphingobium lactosutens]
MTKPPKTAQTAGGETHQSAEDLGVDALTTNHGVPISDNQNSLKSGTRGPTLLEDFVLREKIFHFDHERIPERIVHARGSGAHGVFEATDDISDLSKAAVFTKGEKTEVFVRFSTVAGGAGSVDTPRDVRGFAVKFYTREGNWDLVGNNIPVFFIQDALKFPDLVHAVKMEADRGYPQAGSAHDTFWDWASLMPETTHMLMWAMSDRTLPRSFRTMEGFGVHTFKLVNAAGKASFVKFHWKPRLGLQSTIWDEALKLQAADNDYHRRDLFEAIDTGDYPQWDLGIQVFDEAFANAQPYDVLDATKLIPEDDVPVRLIGTLTLNRNVDNFFAETEQVAFLPSNIPPGIDFSNDPLLQGRLFSYLDTQNSRLGTTNFHQIPINAPRCPFGNFQRDGKMQTKVPKGRANYEPNSLADHGEDGGPRESPAIGFSTVNAATGTDESGDKLRVRSESFSDHYSQARLFYRSQTEAEQAHIASSFVFELSKVGLLEQVPGRMVSNLLNVDEDLAKRVAAGLNIPLPMKAPAAKEPIDMEPSDALSIHKNMKATLEGRAVGVLITDGTDADELAAIVEKVRKAKGKAVIVAPKVGGAKLSDGTQQKADGQLAGTPSQIFDAVGIILSEDGCAAMLKEGAAVEFVMNAFGHLKAIGANDAAQPLLDKAGVVPDDGVTGLDSKFVKAAAQRFYAREPSVRTLA